MTGDPTEAVESGKAMVDMGSRGAHELVRAAAHGVTGGVAAELQGGDFGSGFASSFASSASGSAMGVSGAEGSAWYGTTGNLEPQMITRTAIAAAVGGTVAEIGGGKFGNGAMTSAIQHLVNAEGAANRSSGCGILDNPDEATSLIVMDMSADNPDDPLILKYLEAYAGELNGSLAAAGSDARVDVRSYSTLGELESILAEYRGLHEVYSVTHGIYDAQTKKFTGYYRFGGHRKTESEIWRWMKAKNNNSATYVKHSGCGMTKSGRTLRVNEVWYGSTALRLNVPMNDRVYGILPSIEKFGVSVR